MNEEIKLTKAKSRKMANLLGQWSRAMRELHGYSQEEWADMLHINQSALSRIEAGNQNLLTTQYLTIKNHFTVNIVIEKEKKEEELDEKGEVNES